MAMLLNPYLSFRDDAREAMEHYRSVLGGELSISTFGETPGNDPAEADKVMHAQLETPDGFTLMASDTPSSMEFAPPAGISISLSGDDGAKLRGFWDGLAEGGQVAMPLEVAPWGDAFGVVVDRYGVTWMVNIAGAGAGSS